MENDGKTQEVIDYWKTRFEVGVMPEIIADFTPEEHLRILYYRIRALEKRTKEFEKLLCVMLPTLMILIFLSYAIIPLLHY